MKGFFKIAIRAALFGAAAFAVFACGREIEVKIADQVGNDVIVNTDPSAWVVRFHGVQSETKAQFGDAENGAYPTLWTANDSEVKLSLNYGSAVAADVNRSNDNRSATFDATFDFTSVTAPYVFYSVSPASAAQALSPSRESWKVTIPCEQTPTATSVDEAGIIIAATSIPYDDVAEVSDVDLFFEHLTAYGRLSLANLALSQGETVSAVELTITTPIVGEWYWNTSGSSIVDYGASSTLTINTSRTSDIWFACAPVDVSDEVLVVSVYTNTGVHKQETLFPDNCQFTAGQAAVFSVDMSGAAFTAGTGTSSGSGSFQLITDASTLAAGDEMLIVYTDGNKALGALNTSGNYRDPVDVSISNGSIASEGLATVLTLEAGSTTGTWAFKDGSNYLASQSTANNYLRNSTSITANSSWSISITNDGLATVQAQAGDRNYMLYNPSQPRFTCYDSADKAGMKKVSFYRRSAGGSGQASADPLLDESEYGCYLGTGLTWALDAGAEQVTRDYGTNGVQTYTIIDPSEVEELEIIGYKKSYVKSDSVTVTVCWRKGSNLVHSDAYRVTLVKEVGPKVWLSDGAGKGFIIKK